ncbi:MAG: hypothetical protein WA192_08575 [Candidatus Acidiferrales bacterium]
MHSSHQSHGPLTTSRLLRLAFCATLFAAVAPAAFGQAQAGAATPAAAPESQSAAATKPPAKPASANAAQPAASAQPAANSADSEPQMQDQSAPPPESLGEAARRARTQKAKANTPKVFTDDSVSQLSGHGVSVVGDGSSSEGGGSSSAYNAPADSGAPPAAGGNQEQYWRGRANSIRSQMAQCDDKIAKLQDEIAKQGAVSVDPQSGLQQGVIFVEDRNAEIKQVEEQKAGLQAQLDSLEDEGRKAGADAGWFR